MEECAGDEDGIKVGNSGKAIATSEAQTTERFRIYNGRNVKVRQYYKKDHHEKQILFPYTFSYREGLNTVKFVSLNAPSSTCTLLRVLSGIRHQEDPQC